MKVGIDLDGVLLNAYDTIKNEFEEYKAKYPDRIVADNKLIVTSDHTTLLNGNLGDFVEFYKETYNHYYSQGLPVEGAREFIEKLRNEGHDVIIVTGRTSWEMEKLVGLETIKNMTREWVKKNNLLVSDIIFCEYPSKSKALIDNNVDVFIDDHIKYIYEASKIVPTIWFDVNEDESMATFTSNYKIYKTHDFNLMFNIINYRMKESA